MSKQRRGITNRPDRTVNLQTGEEEDGALMWVPRRQVSQFGRGWFQMAQTTMQRLNAERKTLGLEGIVVFNALMSRLDFENYIQVSQTEIADELEMQRSNVSRAVKRLVDLRIYPPWSKVGKSYTYQLHPELAWKGKGKHHFQAREATRAAGWQVIDGGQQSELDL